MTRKFTLNFIFFSLTLAPVFGQGINFQKITNSGLQNMTAGDATFLDANNDGALDILLAGETSVFPPHPSTKLYFNDGNGNFSEATDTIFPDVGLGAVGHADIDNDGDEDLFICGAGGSALPDPVSALYKNDGSGNFTKVANTPFPPLYYSDMAFADFDNDGDVDILVTGATDYANDNPSQPVAKIYANDGNGNFSELTGLNFQGLYMSSVACVDIDNDGDTDILMMGLDENRNAHTYLYTNGGNGSFTLSSTTLPGLSQGDAVFLDIDGDNDLDLLLSGADNINNPVTVLYLNDGSGHFAVAANNPFPAVALSSFGIGDFNQDGNKDIFLSGWAQNAPIANLYVNNGFGNFSEANTLVFDHVSESATAIGDIDNDGFMDILIMGSNESDVPKTSLYLNQSPTSVNPKTTLEYRLVVYPNPTNNEATIKFYKRVENARLSLYDIKGKKVYETVFSGNQITISLKNLADGTYLIQINGKGKKKIIKHTK